jgi:hypothetical protein
MVLSKLPLPEPCIGIKGLSRHQDLSAAKKGSVAESLLRHDRRRSQHLELTHRDWYIVTPKSDEHTTVGKLIFYEPCKEP